MEDVIEKEQAKEFLNKFYNEYHENSEAIDVSDNFSSLLKAIQRGRIEFENQEVKITLAKKIPMENNKQFEKIVIREMRGGELKSISQKGKSEIEAVFDIIRFCNPEIHVLHIERISQKDFSVVNDALLLYQDANKVADAIKKKYEDSHH